MIPENAAGRPQRSGGRPAAYRRRLTILTCTPAAQALAPERAHGRSRRRAVVRAREPAFLTPAERSSSGG